MENNAQSIFQQALMLHQDGQLEAAAARYAELLKIQPEHVDALHLSGVIAAQSGDCRRAVELIGRAIGMAPAVATLHVNLGNAQLELLQHDAALASFNRAIALGADGADIHANRGNAQLALLQYDAALASYDRALAMQAELADVWSSRGNVLLLLKQAQAALASCDQALTLKPDYAPAWSNRGNALLALKHFGEALASYEQALALKPDFAEVWSNRANALLDMEQFGAALASVEQAILLRPDDAQSMLNRGNALMALQQFAAALASYEQAIALRTDYVEAWTNHGNAHLALGHLEAALTSYDQAMALAPDHAPAWSNRGNVLRDLGQLDAALASFDRALALQPALAATWSDRGIVLLDLQRLDEALASHDQAISLQPDYAEAWSNRGVVLKVLMQIDAALASYDQAIALKPDYAAAHFNKSVACLLSGDFEYGWPLHEWRWHEKVLGRKVTPPFAQPLWLGQESLAGKTILLTCEQGLGDTLQFCRFASSVAGLGARVVLQAPMPLLGLLQTLAGVAELVAEGVALPYFDFYCPLLSLPLALHTTLSSIPAGMPYLYADAQKIRDWRERLGPREKLRVGLVWSGGSRPDQPKLWAVNARRNIDLSLFACFRGLSVEFFSLQKGQPAESRLAELQAAGWDGPGILDFTRYLHDFSDTAALIENLDLVIAVDTSTAHLAAALGKEVWLLNRFDTCWRWLLTRADSPWYPTMTLFRQPIMGDWDSVVSAVAERLRRLAAV